MKVFFDTEFIEDGKTIQLLSIGIVKEDGGELYLECFETDQTRANPWVRENVLCHLTGGGVSRAEIAVAVRKFVGERPEFWAYYAAYDWVVLCQLYGCMINLPRGWPMWCRDLQQEADRLGIELHQLGSAPHHALQDAMWVRDGWFSLAKGNRHD